MFFFGKNIIFLLFFLVFSVLGFDQYVRYEVFNNLNPLTWYICLGNWVFLALYPLDKCESFIDISNLYGIHHYNPQNQRIEISYYSNYSCNAASFIEEEDYYVNQCFNPDVNGGEVYRYRYKKLEESMMIEYSEGNWYSGCYFHTDFDYGCNDQIDTKPVFPNPDYWYVLFLLTKKSYIGELFMQSSNQMHCIYDQDDDDYLVFAFGCIFNEECSGNFCAQDIRETRCEGTVHGKFLELHCYNDCFGVKFDNPKVCSSVGDCTSKDICSCNSTYIGDNCEFCANDFYNHPYCNVSKCFNVFSNKSTVCSGHGECLSKDNCNCSVDYFAEDCSYYLAWPCYGKLSSDPDVCSGNGNCTIDGECICYSDEWFGYECDLTNCICYGLWMNDSNVCTGHGVCKTANTCYCDEKWEGDECEVPICYGLSALNFSVCNSIGICYWADTCLCGLFYTGYECNITFCDDILSSNEFVCNEHGTCIDYNDCDCEMGYEGNNCEITHCFGVIHNNTKSCNEGNCEGFNFCDCEGTKRSGIECTLCVDELSCESNEECVKNTFKSVKNMELECEITDPFVKNLLGDIATWRFEDVGTGIKNKKGKGYLKSYSSTDGLINLNMYCDCSDCEHIQRFENEEYYFCETTECMCNGENEFCNDMIQNLMGIMVNFANISCNPDDRKCMFYQSDLMIPILLDCYSSECVEYFVLSKLSLYLGIGIPSGFLVILSLLVIFGIILLVLYIRNKKIIYVDYESEEVENHKIQDNEMFLRDNILEIGNIMKIDIRNVHSIERLEFETTNKIVFRMIEDENETELAVSIEKEVSSFFEKQIVGIVKKYQKEQKEERRLNKKSFFEKRVSPVKVEPKVDEKQPKAKEKSKRTYFKSIDFDSKKEMLKRVKSIDFSLL